MRINIVEKGPYTFYGIPNRSTVESEFDKYWDKYYKFVSRDYASPIGYSTSPDEEGIFTYYTCIQNLPKQKELFKEIRLPKTMYAIFELKGAVTKTIPVAWKFAKENFVISDTPSIEVYSAGNRLDKNYRMDLWVPISEVLPSYQKNNKGLWEKIKRGIDSAVDGIIDFSKSETGQLTLKLGGLAIVAGVSILLSNNSEDNNEYYLNDENFNSDDYTVDSVEEYNDEEVHNPEVDDDVEVVSRNYPEDRKPPIAHPMRRKGTEEVYAVRGGTEEERNELKEKYGLS